MNNVIGLDLDFPKENLKAALLVSLLSVWVLVGLFYYLNRYTKRRYFTIWTAGWLFYALWLTLGISLQNAGANPLWLMLKQWCLSATAVFLLWGSARFLQLKTRQTLFGLFIAFLFVWSYFGAYHFEAPLQAQLPIFGLVGSASVMTATCFYRFRRQREYMGAGLLSFGFCLWGFYLIAYPFLQNSDQLVSAGFFISAVLQLFIAVSMIVLVLEEARTRNKSALQKFRAVNSANQTLQTKVISTEERYRTLFDHASEAIVITDADGLKILELNQAAERLLGIHRADAAGQSLTVFCQFIVPLLTTSRAGPEWVNLICKQEQLNLVRRDGGVKPVEVACSLIDFGGHAAYQFSFRELTERARLERQLRQAEKLSALGRMISGVAHELNNPLAVIKGYLELVLSSHELGQQTRAYLEKIALEGNRAAKLVGNFLTFARERTVQRQPVDLNQLVQRVTELRQLELQADGVELQLDLDPRLPPTMADADQLQQVLVNLVTNSVHAMAGLAQPRHLNIRTLRMGELIQIIVEDNGPGVPDHLVTSIFEPFFTTKPVGKGTGLGLSIAHRIMSDLHGRIFYRSSSSGGAVFVLELPLVEIEAEVDHPAIAEPVFSMPEETTKSNSAQILVLDDEKSLAEMLGEILQLLGHTPTICHTPSHALELISQQDFDLILSDYRMPTMDGQEFYRKVAEKKPALTRRIVFLTGDLINEESQHFVQTNGRPHLAKPFNLASVQRIVETTLESNSVAS